MNRLTNKNSHNILIALAISSVFVIITVEFTCLPVYYPKSCHYASMFSIGIIISFIFYLFNIHYPKKHQADILKTSVVDFYELAKKEIIIKIGSNNQEELNGIELISIWDQYKTKISLDSILTISFWLEEIGRELNFLLHSYEAQNIEALYQIKFAYKIILNNSIAVKNLISQNNKIKSDETAAIPKDKIIDLVSTAFVNAFDECHGRIYKEDNNKRNDFIPKMIYNL